MYSRRFFSFRSKLVSSTFLASPVGLQKDDNLRLIKGNISGINMPVVFNQEDGKKLVDILDTGFVNLYLISENFLYLLKRENLTGWKTFPIKLFDKKGDEISGYFGFSITGVCEPIDFNKSEIIKKKIVPRGSTCEFYRGLYIDEEQWDGTDFFSPRNTYQIFTTEKAANILKQNKITNLVQKDLANEEIDTRYVTR